MNPMPFRVALGEDYDPADDEGFRARLVAAWYEQVAAQGAEVVSAPVLERCRPLPDSFWLDEGLEPPSGQRDIGYVAVGLAVPPVDAPSLVMCINLADMPDEDFQ